MSRYNSPKIVHDASDQPSEITGVDFPGLIDVGITIFSISSLRMSTEKAWAFFTGLSFVATMRMRLFLAIVTRSVIAETLMPMIPSRDLVLAVKGKRRLSFVTNRQKTDHRLLVKVWKR